MLPPSNFRLAVEKDYQIEDGRVDIWRARLDLHAPDLERLGQFLSADEVDRASRYHFSRDRENFVLVRGLLRLLLGRYLDIASEQIGFAYGARGKPRVANVSSPRILEFNVSHSGELALLAITSAGRVGVDVEQVRMDFDYEEIADRFFSPAEKDLLSTLSEDIKRETFFRIWTRKEAYAKARGEGLALPMDQWEVTAEQENGWCLHSLIPMPGYAGAVAVEASNCRLELIEFDR